MGGIPTLSNYTLVKTLLFEDQNYTELVNSYIANANIKYLVNSQTWWSTSVVIYDLNDLNVFLITYF